MVHDCMLILSEIQLEHEQNVDWQQGHDRVRILFLQPQFLLRFHLHPRDAFEQTYLDHLVGAANEVQVRNRGENRAEK